MSKLTLEQAEKIGHLNIGQYECWIVYEEPNDPDFPKQEPELYDSSRPWCQFYRRICSQPSLEEMLDWMEGEELQVIQLFVQESSRPIGSYTLMWVIVGLNGLPSATVKEPHIARVEDLTRIEAAYKAICIIEGIEP